MAVISRQIISKSVIPSWVDSYFAMRGVFFFFLFLLFIVLEFLLRGLGNLSDDSKNKTMML